MSVSNEHFFMILAILPYSSHSDDHLMLRRVIFNDDELRVCHKTSSKRMRRLSVSKQYVGALSLLRTIFLCFGFSVIHSVGIASTDNNVLTSGRNMFSCILFPLF